MHSACVFKHMRSAFCVNKVPGGWLGILGMRGEERPMQGSVAHAWLHTDKHTKTFNFDLNLRVLGGFCGSAGVKQGGARRGHSLVEGC